MYFNMMLPERHTHTMKTSNCAGIAKSKTQKGEFFFNPNLSVDFINKYTIYLRYLCNNYLLI